MVRCAGSRQTVKGKEGIILCLESFAFNLCLFNYINSQTQKMALFSRLALQTLNQVEIGRQSAQIFDLDELSQQPGAVMAAVQWR